MDGRTDGARELIVAVFRLAIADYLGLSYSHDGCSSTRAIKVRFRTDAESFLRGEAARRLADIGGTDADVIWRETRRLDPSASQQSMAA